MVNKLLKIESQPASIDPVRWYDFVASHPKGNMFHSPAFYRFSSESPNHRAAFLCCMEGDKIRGVLVAVIVSTLPSPFFTLFARSIIFGGPLVLDDDPFVASILLEEYGSRFKREALFSQFRNLSDMTIMNEVFLQSGYNFEDHLDIHIDLSRGKDILWKEMKSARRNKINQGYRLGVSFSDDDPADKIIMGRCYELICSVYSREGLPLPSKSYFEMAATELKQSAGLKLFTARYNGEIIGCRIILAFKDKLYDWYAAASDKHLNKFPNDILPWEIFCWGIERGYRLFDFGGAGKPGIRYGVRDFKKSFGGTIVNYGRFNKVHKPLLNSLIMTAFRLRRTIIKLR